MPALNKDVRQSELNISVVEPVLKKMYHALLKCNLTDLDNCLVEIKRFKIPERNKLIQKTEDYNYESAASLLKEIAGEIGVQIE